MHSLWASSFQSCFSHKCFIYCHTWLRQVFPRSSYGLWFKLVCSGWSRHILSGIKVWGKVHRHQVKNSWCMFRCFNTRWMTLTPNDQCLCLLSCSIFGCCVNTPVSKNNVRVLLSHWTLPLPKALGQCYHWSWLIVGKVARGPSHILPGKV